MTDDVVIIRPRLGERGKAKAERPRLDPQGGGRHDTHRGTPESDERIETEQRKPSGINRISGKQWAVIAVIVFALLWILIGVQNDGDEGSTAMEDAVSYAASGFVYTMDEGRTLVINGEGEESRGASLDQIIFALAALDMPDSVAARMSSTRALDGAQTAEWDGYTATWTYHPDDGLDVIVTR